MKSFKHFLTEALIDVDASDINLIYAPMAKPMKELHSVFKKHLDRLLDASQGTTGRGELSAYEAICRTVERELLEVRSKYQPVYGPLKTIDSSKLKSESAKRAHAINPIKINVWLIGRPHMPNSYNVMNKEINICLPLAVAEAMMSNLSHIPKKQLTMLHNETSDIKHKSTIRHELTHWIDDSLHNEYITKSLFRANDLQKYVSPEAAQKYYKKAVMHNQEDIYLAPIEVTPMVNQIAELKRRVGEKKYDTLTWADVMVYLPSLSHLNTKFGEKYRKVMFTRLARENLIGKNFRAKLQ